MTVKKFFGEFRNSCTGRARRKPSNGPCARDDLIEMETPNRSIAGAQASKKSLSVRETSPFRFRPFEGGNGALRARSTSSPRLSQIRFTVWAKRGSAMESKERGLLRGISMTSRTRPGLEENTAILSHRRTASSRL